MDSNHNPGRGTGAEGMAHHDGSNLPEFIYHSGRTTRDWKDSHYHVCSEIFGGVARLLYRSYLDDDGIPCGFLIEVIEETRTPKGERHPRLPHRDDDHGRVERVHVGIFARYYRRLNDVLRRYSTVPGDEDHEVS